MTSTDTEQPVPWYRPVLKMADKVQTTFSDPNYIILGSGELKLELDLNLLYV